MGCIQNHWQEHKEKTSEEIRVALLGPDPASMQLAAEPEAKKESGGLGKLLLFGAIGFGIFKIIGGKSEEDLDGY